MPPTTPCNSGDVVLVRFPFTDLSSVKQRPAVVVSPAGYSAQQGDIVVVGITSHAPNASAYVLQDWSTAGLLRHSWFKPLIATLSSSILIRKLGVLSLRDRHELSKVLKMMIDPSVLV